MTPLADTRATAAPACAHCGLPVPAALLRGGGEPSFCCAGCDTVWHALREGGLDRYYALRDEAGDAGVPARTTGRSYEEFDDPAFHARSVRLRPDGLATADLYLEGVHCAACLWVVERLRGLGEGLVEIRLDLPRSRAAVTWDPGVTTLSAAARLLDRFGYPPHPVRGAAAEAARRREDRRMLVRIGLAGAVAGNVMAIGFALYGGILHGMEPEYGRLFRWASLVATVPSLVWGGGVFFRGAWSALRARALGMDLPISLGIVAGFLHGAVNTWRGDGPVYFDGVTALIFLLLVGRFIQTRQQRIAGDASELLASLAPARARLLEDREAATAREVPLEALLPGMLVEVRAGDTVPADGTVVAGTSRIDLSLLTGESRPAAAGVGDAVHAGTVNVGARLVVRVDVTGEETRVGRLLRTMEEQAARRAPVVQAADRLSGWFVGGVLVLAAVTAAVWARQDPAHAFDHTIALLIVTCPCALGLATPLAVGAAIGRAARAGILVKGADVLERLSRPGRMWLDKTGTLTEGKVALVHWTGDEPTARLVAAVEAHSAHPAARALVAAFGPAAVGPDRVEETPGGGIEGRVDGRTVLVGSPAFVESRAGTLPGPIRDSVSAWTGEALTPVVVAVDGRAVAAAALGDRIREDARAALDALRAHGWEIGILSGDHPDAVAAVGRALGIADARGGVSPEGKLQVVRDLPGVMVGDGVNDAAALAAAPVGIGVHGGAEACLAAADVSIVRPGIAPVVDLVEGARRTMRTIRRNFALSLAYNALGVVLAMGGMIDPLVAAVLMPASSLTVIVSSYRARTFR